MRSRHRELTPTQRTVVSALGAIQVALAVLAWIDLARRPAASVRGTKKKWAAVIAVNWIGPIWYFARGRRPA